MGAHMDETLLQLRHKGGDMSNDNALLVARAELRRLQDDEFNLAASAQPTSTEGENVSESVNKTGIDATLDERGSRYGLFTDHAAITQSLKAAMYAAPKWAALQPDQKEALEMVQHKIGRILNGDPDYHDSWHDVVGYAKLVADRLAGVQR